LYDGEETNLVEIYDTETNSWIAGDPHSTKSQKSIEEEESSESEDMDEE
jgi:hypothetical protein